MKKTTNTNAETDLISNAEKDQEIRTLRLWEKRQAARERIAAFEHEIQELQDLIQRLEDEIFDAQDSEDLAMVKIGNRIF